MNDSKTAYRSYTIYSYRLARTLLHRGCKISDLRLNKQRGGLLFYFVDEPMLRKVIDAEKDRREILEIRNEFADENEKRYGYWDGSEKSVSGKS